jgi:hypothetical protein
MATTNEVTYLEVTGLITLGSSLVAVYSLDASFTRFRVATEIEERGRKRLHVIYKSYSGLRSLLETLRDSGCKFREVCGPDPFPAAHSR